MLGIWRDHFANLCTPKSDPSFDNNHYEMVSASIQEWLNLHYTDTFLDRAFSPREISYAISKLNLSKAPGSDLVCAEHLKYGGEYLVLVLQLVFRWVIDLEYVPKALREGIQVPLHKGKNTPTTDPDNYRGITLLSVFCKVLEMLVWARMEKWWLSKISPLQGAGRKGVSCTHSALLLQETVSSRLNMGNKVFVTYFDVSKAFDSVWIDGLFYQLRTLGIVGVTWRLLYKMYVNFRCRVRLGDKLSDWYIMRCGIHQGGYLSLVKYVSFINTLVNELKESKLCIAIDDIPSSPVSYADDLATASTAKCNVDGIMRIAHTHSCRWRYRFNARKSAVLVYGENKRDAAKNAVLRQYSIGGDRVYERSTYDHVGIKSCTGDSFLERTNEKIKKGRRAFFSTLSLGIKKRGLTMNTCNLLFWSVIVPITLFGSELWVLQASDLHELDLFQRQVSRRMQRFHGRAPIHTSVRGLGWMRLETLIYAKKVMFLRTILCMAEDTIYRRVLMERLRQFLADPIAASANIHFSPLFDILRITAMFGMMNMTINMANNTHVYSKVCWKKEVWLNAWKVENEEWGFTTALFPDTHYLKSVLCDAREHLIWWEISNRCPESMHMCENIAAMICRASLLKSDSIEFKGTLISARACENCDSFSEENVEHIIMQCSKHAHTRGEITRAIAEFDEMNQTVLGQSHDILMYVLGKDIIGVDDKIKIDFWHKIGQLVNRIYEETIISRSGIG